MAYAVEATSETPALVIYLLDVSASMGQPLGGVPRIEVVRQAFRQALTVMVGRSTKGARISPRYHMALYAYSDHVWDLLTGITTVDRVAAVAAKEPLPLETQRSTDTAKAFAVAEKLLTDNLEQYWNCPPPVVCHMTDGEFTGAAPGPIVQRIRQLAVADGPVLVENIFISDNVLPEGVPDVRQWRGVKPDTPLNGRYAEELRAMSSPLPASYRIEMVEQGYPIDEGALMFLPGMSPDLVALGLQLSGVTK
jgi:hypothetical protein